MEIPDRRSSIRRTFPPKPSKVYDDEKLLHLNARVAEVVLEYKRLRNWLGRRFDDDLLRLQNPITKEVVTVNDLPKWSTELEAAWELVNAYDLMIFPRTSTLGWCVVPWRDTTGTKRFTRTASVSFEMEVGANACTMPVAVCLSVLRSNGLYIAEEDLL